MPLRPRTLIVAGIATLLLGLVLLFPARVAYRWFAPAAVAFSGVDGTLWRGKAGDGQIGGVYLRNINWRMRPAALLTGRIAYNVDADTASGFLTADVALSPGGNVLATDLNASLSLQSMQQLARMSGLDGMLSLQFERLEIVDGLPVAASGTLEVANLRAPLIYRAPIGGFRAEFFTQETGVVASIEDTQAVIDLAGSLSIGADRSYRFVAQVAPKADTPADLREQMRFLGSPNQRGQYEMRLEGQL